MGCGQTRGVTARARFVIYQNKESTMTSGQVRPGGDRELKVHDGIVGTLILLSVGASVMLNPACDAK